MSLDALGVAACDLGDPGPAARHQVASLAL